MNDDSMCFECGERGCSIVANTYAFCGQDCQAAYMASLLA